MEFLFLCDQMTIAQVFTAVTAKLISFQVSAACPLG